MYVDTDEDEASTRELVRMGEQTCYPHAAMSGSFKSRIRVVKGIAKEDYEEED